jgi:GAF domain-containing protein
VARIEGRDVDAMRRYEQAIRSAREQGFVHNEGLAYEVAARFCGARGFETFADAYLRKARDCYLSWGADGKVLQLDRLYPHLAAAEEQRPSAIIGSPVQHLDVACREGFSGLVQRDRVAKADRVADEDRDRAACLSR